MHMIQKIAVPLLLPFAYAIDIKQLLVQRAQHYRNLQNAPSGDLLCIVAALTFGSTTDPTTQEPLPDGVLMQTLGLLTGSDLTAICPDPSSCDLTDSSLYSEAKAICDTAGGQVLTTDISVCKDTIITLAESFDASTADLNLEDIQEVSISNIPVCLPPEPTCPADFDLFPALGNTLESIIANMPPSDDPAADAAAEAVVTAVTEILEGKECSSATSSSVSSLFVAGFMAVFSSMIVAATF